MNDAQSGASQAAPAITDLTPPDELFPPRKGPKSKAEIAYRKAYDRAREATQQVVLLSDSLGVANGQLDRLVRQGTQLSAGIGQVLEACMTVTQLTLILQVRPQNIRRLSDPNGNLTLELSFGKNVHAKIWSVPLGKRELQFTVGKMQTLYIGLDARGNIGPQDIAGVIGYCLIGGLKVNPQIAEVVNSTQHANFFRTEPEGGLMSTIWAVLGDTGELTEGERVRRQLFDPPYPRGYSEGWPGY